MKKILKLLIPTTTLLVPISAVGCSCSNSYVAFPEEYLNITSDNKLAGFKDEYDYQDKLEGYNTLTIPETVVAINDAAFAYNKASKEDGALAIKKIDFAGKTNACTKLGNGSFTGCINLETVVFPPKFDGNDVGLFNDCSNLSILDFSHVEAILTFNEAMFTYDYANKGKIIVNEKNADFAKRLQDRLKIAERSWDIEKNK